MLSKKKFKKKQYKSVVIGAGRIGAFFDSPKSKDVVTHAHALTKHPRILFEGFFDMDKNKSSSAAKVWGTNSFEDMSDMMTAVRPDIVSVCVPDEYHSNILMSVVDYKPKLVICEKPLTTNLKDSLAVIECYSNKKIPILVNYSRRFSKTFQTLKNDINQNKYGQVLTASGIYTKGILHNGSHLLDLAAFFFGKLKESKSLFGRMDYKSSDKTVGGFASFEKCPQFYLMAGDERVYSIFEMDILFERARFTIINDGFNVLVRHVVDDPRYKGYLILSGPKKIKTDYGNVMYNMVDNAVKYLNGQEDLLCTAEQALEVQKIATQFLGRVA
ncbi:MAG: Gfo/Idh/MocA family oxidoreductase [Candidatus Vogelbacteria bacterium]|nr:Gfo/Idh/MocA family oxidoreductase [Candidatus Vogelbacteria bacterium]